MITIRNVVIDELMEILTRLKTQQGVTRVDLICDGANSRVQISPIIDKKFDKKFDKTDDGDLDMNKLLS